MEEFTEEDIKILDFMVDCMLDRGYVTWFDFTNSEYDIQNNEIKAPHISSEDFSMYLSLLNEYNICDINSTKDGESGQANSSTFVFKKQGGFKSLNEKLKEENYKTQLELRKTEVDLDLAEKTLREFPKTKLFARIGFFIGIVLALKELYLLFS